MFNCKLTANGTDNRKPLLLHPYLPLKRMQHEIWINRAGQNLGTYTLEESNAAWIKDSSRRRSCVARGMESWKPLSEFPG